MPVFVVHVDRNAEEVASRIGQLPEEDSYRLAPNVWMIDHDGTTRALAEKIGIRGEQAVGAGIAFPISNYSGRASSDVWEWLQLHLSRLQLHHSDEEF